MDAKPTYHLPPNFSTPPPDKGGPFHLGTVLRDFERKEQMRPLTQGEKQIIAPTDISLDHKGGFTATRERMKSGELGIWAKFMGLEGVGGEASISAERSNIDTYTFSAVDTEFFYPSEKYVSDCLKLSNVEDYLKGSRYNKAIYVVTGLKVAKGVSVKVEKKTNLNGKLEVGVNGSASPNVQLGPKAEGKIKDEPTFAFTESSDIVVGIQCLKVYHEESSWFMKLIGKGDKHVESEFVTSGASFYGEGDETTEDKGPEFVAVGPQEYNTPGLVSCADGADIWMVPKE